MRGHLHLTAARDPAADRSYVREQSFRAPMHVGKGYWHEDALLVHAVNSTAGWFAGDVVEWWINVEPGARLRLVSPSATRVHRAAREEISTARTEPAWIDQTFRVGAKAWLEVWPELFIPHAGCRYRQTTRIEIEPGGELLFCESLAPGRVASGEAFAWESLCWATDIHYGGEPVARERWRMQPGVAPDPLVGWKGAGGVASPYYATIFFVSDRVGETDLRWQQIHDLQADDLPASGAPLWIGVSRLRAAGWTVKILARDGAALRGALGRVRAALLQP